jgi:hypothetical protein
MLTPSSGAEYKIWRNCTSTENHWVCGLCPSSGILNKLKTQRFGNWICFRPQVREGDA